uniref:Minor capsid protein P8 central region domain-containing protein n=1 Tax=viral metagenome TaxID=1070528 RepID=A0A6C0KUE8_9ZZZZ
MSTGAPLPEFELPYTRHGLGGQNGRVNLTPSSSNTGAPVPDSAGFSYPKQTEASFAGDMLRGNWDHTVLSDTFFTRRNATVIQNAIKKEVYRMSGPKQYQIDDQDVDELKMIMRAMYLQYAKNNPHNIEGQIQELNKLVVDWAAPRIMSEIDHYHYYLNDISHLPVPLEKPLNMSSAGSRSLPFKPMM